MERPQGGASLLTERVETEFLGFSTEACDCGTLAVEHWERDHHARLHFDRDWTAAEVLVDVLEARGFIVTMEMIRIGDEIAWSCRLRRTVDRGRPGTWYAQGRLLPAAVARVAVLTRA